ncbi:hypothetical protein CHELA41_24448 [Hyphomicrobiales bacterium]|nr:hypothetical protein CHELA41_24448 [Hyphomicrobiales bacterium]
MDRKDNTVFDSGSRYTKLGRVVIDLLIIHILYEVYE